jgi:hypothetical protein
MLAHGDPKNECLVAKVRSAGPPRSLASARRNLFLTLSVAVDGSGAPYCSESGANRVREVPSGGIIRYNGDSHIAAIADRR